MQEIALPTEPGQELNDTEIIVFCQPCLKKKEEELFEASRRRFPKLDDESHRFSAKEDLKESHMDQWLWMTNGANSGFVRCRFCDGWIEITPEMVEPFREEDVRCLMKSRYRTQTTAELHS